MNAAEDAGIRLAHGCRQGICQLCRCIKSAVWSKISHRKNEQ
nr:2Fe-2S iron-sulfur cluster-binding protein [Psychrobacter sp. WY6]